MYHKIAEVIPGALYPGLSVPPSLFKKQTSFLAKRGFEVFSLENLDQSFQSTKPISITFDDGYQDFSDAAAPILSQFNFTGTVFLVSDLLGQENRWDVELGEHPARLMNEKTIVELAQKGFEFGSHTRTHVHLDQVETAVQEEQIISSRTRLVETLGLPINTFCYPYGGFNDTSVELTRKAGYSCAVTTQKGLNTKETDRFRLNRIAVRNDTLMPVFVYKLWRAYRFGK